jgi:pyruvate dehydrogenase E1 component
MSSSSTPASDSAAADIDPVETREWLEALADVLQHDGAERARFLLATLLDEARAAQAAPAGVSTTPYVNTIGKSAEPAYPGDLEIEAKLMALMRWNAMALVVNANKKLEGIGGHIATYQSAAQLFETGFQHFWQAPGDGHGGDLVFFQGHASPGVYARAFVEGRLSEDQMKRFRQESEPGGLSSYPHPWLMPELWQFATVSMGLGPLMAIYQARFLKYLHNRGLLDTARRKVWAFLGDGEMDEVESIGAVGLPVREKLDNLVFVVNCNLQRLDGPVRGNAKIVQELESIFGGAGWRVIKVMWGGSWDALFEADHDGRLKKLMMDSVDGEWQAYAAKGGAYFRQNFFGKDPELLARVAHLSDQQLASLERGGHDPKKVFAAYQAAVSTVGQPVLILAQTVKGYGMSASGEALNIAHQQKKMGAEDIRAFRDRFVVAVDDEGIEKLPFLKPAEGSPEHAYLHQRRQALGGYLPQRRRSAPALAIPGLEAFESMLGATGEREISTTRAFVNALSLLLRDKNLKERIVPILADEARTFGMEGLFRQIGIYSPWGQLYQPVDSDQLMFYKEAKNGQILQEGINEAGAMSSWIAAGMSYSSHGLHMIPFYIFYSMFGFQRIGDLIWAAADMQARGFLLGGTSGRTTLNGEGLQHEDGHSHLIAATVPNCVAYDPSFQFELAVIVQDGLRRMFGEENQSVFYYLTVLNENYSQPAMPEGAAEGVRRGMYLFRPSAAPAGGPRVQLLGCGAILREVLAAAKMLEEEWGVAADVWSCPSFTELRRDGLAADRRSLLQPEAEPAEAYVTFCLKGTEGPVIASTDYMKAYADLIRPWVPRRYVTLGTDGFGRSDTREALRHFFEVDRRWVTVAALKALADDAAPEARPVLAKKVSEAIARYGIDVTKPDPTTV